MIQDLAAWLIWTFTSLCCYVDNEGGKTSESLLPGDMEDDSSNQFQSQTGVVVPPAAEIGAGDESGPLLGGSSLPANTQYGAAQTESLENPA